MNAHEMFVNLGYSLKRNDFQLLVYEKNNFILYFEKYMKSFSCYEKSKYRKAKPVICNFAMYLAITQQMKELGWIE